MPTKTPTAPASATAPQFPEPSTRTREAGTKRNPMSLKLEFLPDESAQMRAIRLVLERD